MALTRHTRNVTCFVSNPESKLRHQLYQDISRDITLDFRASTDDLEQEMLRQKHEYLQGLKSSPSISEKARGYSLSAWGAVRGQLLSGWERIQDRRPDGHFYRVDRATDTMAEVSVVDSSQQKVLGALEEPISRSKAISLAKEIVCYPSGPTPPSILAPISTKSS